MTGDNISAEEVFSLGAFSSYDNCFSYFFVFQQSVFDFSQLYPEAPDFYLEINPTPRPWLLSCSPLSVKSSAVTAIYLKCTCHTKLSEDNVSLFFRKDNYFPFELPEKIIAGFPTINPC